LHVGLEVDQQIAAADQVHSEKRRILQEILRRKGDRVPERLPDGVGVVLRFEPALEALGRDILGDARRIGASPGRGQHPFRDVGGE
jgi:hypothetical protein